MERRVAVRAIIVKDGKLLCVKLKDYGGDGAGSRGAWCTIGGGVPPGEALLPALKREVVEETGVEPSIGSLLYVQQFAFNNGAKEHLEFFFHVTNADDFLNIDLSKTSHGAAEIDQLAFIDPVKENVLPKFLNKENYKNLSSAQTKFFNYL